MRSSCHSLDRVEVNFDDERLVANAGLIAPASLAQHLGLRELFDRRVDLGDAPGRANVGHKAMTVIHSVLAAGDSIDGCEVLRAGATGEVLGHELRAPSTIGTFLRSFSWGHARQLDAVAGEALVRAWQSGGGPTDGGGPFTIDLDSSIHETYGFQKKAASGATRMCAATTRCTPSPPMAVKCSTRRLRGGNAHTARGAVGFLAETFRRVRAAEATAALMVRADSGFYSAKVVRACQVADVRFSITVKLYKNVHASISAIPEPAWQPIPYWLENGADVAAVDWRAFTPRTDEGIPCRLVVRRTRPTPGSQLALITEYSYHAFMTDRDGDPVELDAWHRSHANCENAIRDLKYGVGLNHLPSGRFGANAAWLTLNVIAHNLSRWTARISSIDIENPTATAENAPERQDHRQAFVTTDTLRRRYLAIPGRLATSARRVYLHLPSRWPWAEQFNTMLDAIRQVELIT